MTDTNRYMNLTQAAEKTGIGRSRLKRLIKEGLIKAYYPGKWLIPVEELDHILDKFSTPYWGHSDKQDKEGANQ